MNIKILASGSTGNCYLVDDGKTPLLLECGIPFKKIQRLLNFKMSEIAGCLITHEHLDHAKAIKDIASFGIDCYMTQGTKAALNVDSHRIKIIEARRQFRLGTWTILPFGTQHDAAEPVVYLLASGKEKLLYATDTYYIKYKFTGLTYIMLECNYAIDILRSNVEAGTMPEDFKNRLIKSHFSLENVKEFLKANELSKVQGIYLLHLSDSNSDEKRFKREIQALTGKPVYVA